MGRYILSTKKWVCIKYVGERVFRSLREWRQAEPTCKRVGAGGGGMLEHLDMAIYPLERAQMLGCPGQPRGLTQGQDVGKAEEVGAGGVYHE